MNTAIISILILVIIIFYFYGHYYKEKCEMLKEELMMERAYSNLLETMIDEEQKMILGSYLKGETNE